MAPARSRGFSLIEVTIAVAIIGMMAVSTGALLQRIPVSGREVRDQDLALKIARNELEILRAGGYAALPESGSFADPLLSSLDAATAAVSITDANEKTKLVEVSVSWSGAEALPRTVTLTTLVTEDGGV